MLSDILLACWLVESRIRLYILEDLPNGHKDIRSQTEEGKRRLLGRAKENLAMDRLHFKLSTIIIFFIIFFLMKLE